MRRIKNLIILTFVICIVISSSSMVFASEIRVKMSDMHYMDSSHVKEISKPITDSYGNTYSYNIVRFSTSDNAYISYDLNGAYKTFEAKIVCSNETSSRAVIDVGIFADGVLVYSLKDYNRQKPAETVALDVTGVGILSIKTLAVKDYDYVYFVDSYFTRSDKSTTYPVRGELVDQVLIDSHNCRISKNLFFDSYGDLHNGYVYFNTYEEGYALFNLNGAYEKFCGTVVSHPDTRDKAVGSIKIYVDDVEVYSRSGIKKTSAASTFEVNVSNGKVLKIVVKGNGTNFSDVIVTDTLLKVHEHILSDWEIVSDPTCTEMGRKHQVCTECGEEINSEYIPVLGHKPDGKWETVREATCSNEGEEVQHCSVCHEVCGRRSIPVVPHTPLDKWITEKDPTCVERGSKVRRCSECGEIVERELTDTIDHDFGEWKVVKGNYWNNPIVSERVCSMCGKVETEESYPTPWIKPLVLVISFLILAVIIVLCIILKLYYLPIRPSSLKKLVRKKSITDEDIEKLIKKSDEQLKKKESD